ncbi:uncharacterized protein EV422DRAFT_99726 [Fimicolochytrium jonesii]|uniref:uncharacterized protein n=1 Tax=Fimicolochytrium jonesii TaxID=1396493 RepID=UPI0022FF05BE|nr:uncharacterized protein EV422DRAFT_99726 [Fimicolochytrium jonesii]KAI8819617.1 hypothetical protein EV422DRAFT_99726 [Fimicolochytrium jonesii]
MAGLAVALLAGVDDRGAEGWAPKTFEKFPPLPLDVVAGVFPPPPLVALPRTAPRPRPLVGTPSRTHVIDPGEVPRPLPVPLPAVDATRPAKALLTDPCPAPTLPKAEVDGLAGAVAESWAKTELFIASCGEETGCLKDQAKSPLQTALH